MVSWPGATAPSSRPFGPLPRIAAVCAALLVPAVAAGQGAAKPELVKPEPGKSELAKPDPTKLDAPPRDVRAYCANIAVAASDARIAWQTARLAELEARLKASIQALDARTAELRALAEKRAAMEKAAGEKLVGIYAKMRAETAAAQISGLDDEMAAAVLGQLAPRQAGLIFNEIAPERAAKLAVLVAGLQPEKDAQIAKASPPERKP